MIVLPFFAPLAYKILDLTFKKEGSRLCHGGGAADRNAKHRPGIEGAQGF